MQASISTTELLYKLRENRTKHVETYEAAMQVYRQRLITEFESRLAQLDLSHEADEIAAVLCKSEVGVGFDWRSGRPVTVVVNACVCPDDFMKEQS
jgi:hypothetical protein